MACDGIHRASSTLWHNLLQARGLLGGRARRVYLSPGLRRLIKILQRDSRASLKILPWQMAAFKRRNDGGQSGPLPDNKADGEGAPFATSLLEGSLQDNTVATLAAPSSAVQEH